MTEREQAEDLHLALAQAVGWSVGFRRRSSQLSTRLRVRVGLARSRRPHRVDKLVAGRVLQHEAKRPGAHRLTRERRVLLHGEHHDRCVGRLLPQLWGSREG